MSSDPNLPASGWLAEPSDLEKIMSLDDWLSNTDHVRKDRSFGNAWARGNTDCAFAFNNWLGVQKSHASNVWEHDWQGPDVGEPHLEIGGHGLYVYMPHRPVIRRHLDQQTTHQRLANDEIDNKQSIPLSETLTYEDQSARELSISEPTSIGFSVKGNFDMEGFSFEASTAFDQSSTQGKTQSSITKTDQQITINVPPETTAVFTCVVSTTVENLEYGLDFKLGEASEEGGIALATHGGHPDQWVSWLKISDVLARADKLGQETQTIRYKVTKTTKLTKCYTGEKQADGKISWHGNAPPS